MVRRLFCMAMGVALSVGAWAQEPKKEKRVEFGLEYNTELQTNFKRAKWLNLLRMDMSVAIVKGLSFNASTLSAARTDEEPMIDDLQGFSNIEAENMPLTLAVLSLDWETEHTTLSVGLRNFDENHFATDLTSFFTQSSHGIFPTISANFPIATYPMASLGVDFQWRIKAFTLDASLYNGTGYKDFSGRENLFRFCPKDDGVFGALQLSHEADYGNSHVGVAVRGDSERTRAALWGYTELNLTEKMQLLAQYSFAPGSGVECTQYAGLGLKRAFGKVEVGVAEVFARFNQLDEATQTVSGVNEWATEFSARFPVMKHVALQPVVHLCHSGGDTHCVGMLRLNVSL